MLKKTKILMLVLFSIFLIPLLALNTNAAITSCTLNNPSSNQYDNGTIVLNVTAVWSQGNNLTNVTITIGSSVFSNTTINGTATNATAGATAIQGDFTFTLVDADLADNAAYTTYATCYNTTDSTSIALNSSSITYTVDTLNPVVTIQKPNAGETVSAKGTGLVIIDYTPTDTNLGNSTYYINDVRQSSSTSGTTGSNLTSGSRKNTFSKYFGSNNNSITLKIEITDLAGRKTNSSTTTFNVFREGAAEPAIVFVTPSGEVISSPAQPKGKAITKPFTFGNIGIGGLLNNPIVWGGIIIAAVGLFIWWQNRKR